MDKRLIIAYDNGIIERRYSANETKEIMIVIESLVTDDNVCEIFVKKKAAMTFVPKPQL